MYFYFGAGEANEVFLRIEVMDMVRKHVLADFVESNNFDAFNGFYERRFPEDGPSMLLFKNYTGRALRQGTAYLLFYSVLQRLFYEGRITIIEDSYIIRAEVDLSGIEEEVFERSISYNALQRRNGGIYRFELMGNAELDAVDLPQSGATEVVVKNIGQGSWNEVFVDGTAKLVFDTGTHYSTKAQEIQRMLNGQDLVYERDRPGLIVSHWDVDHYHFLKAMSNATISRFSFILCRNFTPSLMSRAIFSRLMLWNPHIIALPADPRTTTLRETPLYPIFDNRRFVIFNSGVSRNRNKDGISLLIRNARKSILLPGDQHYNQFSQFVIPAYLNYRHRHYMIVPHHGGHAGSYKYALHPQVSKGYAVISVGANTYGHPFPKVVNSLRTDQFIVHRTDIKGKDIAISL